jgi:2-polyprenyl-6-methoxyphenol hydroxylase-like FAD-dependent oxidoreductase
VARSRLASMRAGRVVAIGDTAHEVSPIGGQGMNLGLIDAVTLAPLLVGWLRGGDAPAELARWERERIAAAERSGRIATVNTALGRPSGPAAALAVRAALATPAARLLARAYAMGFDPAAAAVSGRARPRR